MRAACRIVLTLILCAVVNFGLVLHADEPSLLTSGSAEVDSVPSMSKSSALDWTLMLAIAIAVTHVTSPITRRILLSREGSFGSFGGGMASGYVFIHLFSELDEGERVFGDRLHLFILAGFLAYYAAEFFLARRRKYEQSGITNHFQMEIALSWIYSWLLVYSLPDQLRNNGLTILPIVVTLMLHICFADADLGKLYPRRFDRAGRWVLATAPLVGWLTDLYVFGDNPMVSDILTALLAGSVIGKLFRHELPDDQESSFLWYLSGAVVFVSIDLMTRGM